MDLRKLRKFIRENKLTFAENTTETTREFIIEQKDSKYKLRALLSENNTKMKFILENAKNLVVEEYETDVENNEDMIKKVKDAVALYDMIDDIDGAEDDNLSLDINKEFKDTLPNSIEDEDDSVNEELLIDQPADDQEVELVEKKPKTDEDLCDELGVPYNESKKLEDFNSRYAIKTNNGYVKLINNDASYQIVESAESATYSGDKEEMKAQLIKLAKQEDRPLKAGKIVDLDEEISNKEDKEDENSMKKNGIEVAGVQTAPISSSGSIGESFLREDYKDFLKRELKKIQKEIENAPEGDISGLESRRDFIMDKLDEIEMFGESLEIKVREDNDIIDLEEASKKINELIKMIKKLYENETDSTVKTILGSIDLNLQIPQGQIDELKNIR